MERREEKDGHAWVVAGKSGKPAKGHSTEKWSLSRKERMDLIRSVADQGQKTPPKIRNNMGGDPSSDSKEYQYKRSDCHLVSSLTGLLLGKVIETHTKYQLFSGHDRV